MGSWAYCHSCDCGIGPPSVREAFAGKIECPRCSTERELDEYDRLYYGVEKMLERIEELEKKVRELDNSG